MKMKTEQSKPVGHCKSSAKGKVHSNTGIPQETNKQKSQINNLTLQLKQIEKKKRRIPGLVEGKKS